MTTAQLVRFHAAILVAVLLAIAIMGLGAKPLIEDYFRTVTEAPHAQ